MRSFCAILVLACGLASCQGCGNNTEATKPAVIPASPGSMPSAGGDAKAGSTTKPAAPM